MDIWLVLKSEGRSLLSMENEENVGRSLESLQVYILSHGSVTVLPVKQR